MSEQSEVPSVIERGVAARGGPFPLVGGILALICFFLPYASSPALLGFQISRSGFRIGGALWLVFLAATAVILIYLLLPGERARRDRELLIRISAGAGLATLLIGAFRLYQKSSFFGLNASAADFGVHLNVGAFGSLLGLGLAFAATFARSRAAEPFQAGPAELLDKATAAAAPALSSTADHIRQGSARLQTAASGLTRHAAQLVLRVRAWSGRHVWGVGAAAIIVLVSSGAYAVFRPTPENDAATVGAAYAACSDQMHRDAENDGRALLKAWAAGRPASRSAARQQMDGAYTQARTRFADCLASADSQLARANRRYIEKPERYSSFYAAFGQRTNGVSMTADQFDARSASTPEIQRVFESIRPPLPVDAMLIDNLLGTTVDGWRFAYPSEFISVGREAPVFVADTAVLRLHLNLQDYNTHQPYFAIADVRYTVNAADEWSYNGVRELYLATSDTLKYRPNGALFLIGKWRWAGNYVTYQPDGTWTGTWDDGSTYAGEWRIVHDNLVLTRNGYPWVNATIASATDSEIVLQGPEMPRAERVR